MEHRQPENRRDAARKFMESMAELEAALQADEAPLPTPASSPSAQPPATSPPDVDWETALSEAAQDIEQFMNAQEHKPEA